MARLMTVWFTGDTHFGHEAIIRHTYRPFHSVEEHDATLINRWNEVVKKGDVVYHVGDFAWKFPAFYTEKLNGQIHLIKGNHDRLNVYAASQFASVSYYKKVKVGEQSIYLLHYAMRVWNRSHYGSWHLYGHSHGTLPDDRSSLSLDVGVDCHHYYPISFERVAELMAQKHWQPKDHHRPKGWQ